MWDGGYRGRPRKGCNMIGRFLNWLSRAAIPVRIVCVWDEDSMDVCERCGAIESCEHRIECFMCGEWIRAGECGFLSETCYECGRTLGDEAVFGRRIPIYDHERDDDWDFPTVPERVARYTGTCEHLFNEACVIAGQPAIECNTCHERVVFMVLS